MSTTELQAGRELDALIAEKVMGFHTYGLAIVKDSPPPDWDGFVVDTIPQGYYWPIPHYSTDIAAAWEVVEKLTVLYPGTQLTLKHRQGLDPDYWLASWQVYDNGRWRWSPVFGRGEGPTVPLAICRLALGEPDFD